ncbi:hypothetical protein VW23_006495 [Devosia insulae DS-56]|uniref:Uncharacterized protein n=1 Tax=Devosia insulae DS-56 TaxID=1116389 RepID=A0A1E5XHG2_9HYPH|nr:hypothetical protein [Devosia insulae]OEO28041.1 hypothetical protein VW23_006495 [Devosia insulae DS-56]
MHQEHSSRSRIMNPIISQRKLARERVAPYLGELKRWQSKSLQLRALHNSRHQSADALAIGQMQLAALRTEIEMARQAFILEMDDIADMPAVVDYLAALDSLLRR